MTKCSFVIWTNQITSDLHLYDDDHVKNVKNVKNIRNVKYIKYIKYVKYSYYCMSNIFIMLEMLLHRE